MEEKTTAAKESVFIAKRSSVPSASTTAMRIVLLHFTMILLGCSVYGDGVSDLKPQVNAVTRVSASPDGKFVALLNEASDGDRVQVLSCCTDSALVFTVDRKDLARYVEEPEVDSIEWSADGRALKIAINDREEDHAIVVVEPARGVGSLRAVSVDGSLGAWGTWSTSGHRLYVTPASDKDGVYVVDPIAGTATRLMKGYKIATHISATETFLVVKVEQFEGVRVKSSLISIDLRTGSVNRLAP